MSHSHVTDPMPVFPTAGAHPWTERTPMGLEVEAAMEKAVQLLAAAAGTRHLPVETVNELVQAKVGDFLDDYARTLEKASMEALVDEEVTGCGIVAVWHGGAYSVAFSPNVPAGYLVEERCFCGQRPTELN